MIRLKNNMQKYKELKYSGVEWIGDIPKHWNLSRLKYEIEIHNKRRIPLSSEERGERQGPYPYYGSTSLIDWVDNFLFDGRYILIAEDGANLIFRNLRLSFIVEGKFWVNNHAHILKSKDYQYDQYYCELLELTDFRKYITGSAQPKLTLESLKNIPLCVPPIEEQKLISQYLDQKIRKIDSLIEKIKEKIELLKEQKTALINRYVTKGLDPNVEMKDSGMEWIGKIPKHWKISRLGYESDVIDPQPDHRAPEIDENGYPYIGIRDIDENGEVNISTCRLVKLTAIEKQEKSYEINNDDLIFCKVGTLGFSRFFKKPSIRFALSATLVIIKINKENDPRFINFALQSEYIYNVINFESTGSTRKALGIQTIRNFKIALPPLKTQNKIADILEKKFKNFNNLIKKIEEKLDLIREYRQSLISSVVTGKIRVTENMI